MKTVMFEKKPLLNKIFIKNLKGMAYVIFEHDDKTWVMPEAGLSGALEMYQPSTLRGKLLKLMVRYGYQFPIIAGRLGIVRAFFSVNGQIPDALNIQGKEYYVAGYMGDTSSQQNNKATVQIYDEKEMICFLKITENAQVSKNFKHEIKALNFLNAKEVQNVPKVLFNEKIGDLYLFAQTTSKNFKDRLRMKLNREHLDFLRDLNEKTMEKLPYEESEFAYYVEYLKQNQEMFTEEQKAVLEQGIFLVEDRLLEKPYRYSFFHGDFTPWNVYFVQGRIQSFDFEYCHYKMPEYMDVFHFLTQMAMLGKNAQAGGVVHEYRKYYEKISRYISNPDFTYVCYLVFIISFYVMRTNEKNQLLQEKIEIWMEVLEYQVAKK